MQVNEVAKSLSVWPTGWTKSYIKELRDGGYDQYLLSRNTAAQDLEISVWDLDEIVGFHVDLPQAAGNFLILIHKIFKESGRESLTTVELVAELCRLGLTGNPAANPPGLVAALGVFGIEPHKNGAGTPRVYYHKDLIQLLELAGDDYKKI